jgi:hypothetical protein
LVAVNVSTALNRLQRDDPDEWFGNCVLSTATSSITKSMMQDIRIAVPGGRVGVVASDNRSQETGRFRQRLLINVSQHDDNPARPATQRIGIFVYSSRST